MRRILFSCVVALCVLASVRTDAVAQTSGPPKLLWIFVEEIKPGKGSAHERVEAGYAQAFRDAKTTPYLAMTSITGRSEVWFVTAFDSYEAWEKETQSIEKNAKLTAALARLDEQDAPFRTNQRSLVARYREDLSYNASINLGEMRYFQIITYRVRPGHNAAFEEARRMSKEFHEKAKVNEHFAIFQVESGTLGPTYILILPRKSLKDIDDDPHTKAYQDAVGDDGRKKLAKMTAEDVLSVENSIFAFSARMSYPREDLVKADPAFWKPKPLARTPGPKREAAKTAPTKP